MPSKCSRSESKRRARRVHPGRHVRRLEDHRRTNAGTGREPWMDTEVHRFTQDRLHRPLGVVGGCFPEIIRSIWTQIPLKVLPVVLQRAQQVALINLAGGQVDDFVLGSEQALDGVCGSHPLALPAPSIAETTLDSI